MYAIECDACGKDMVYQDGTQMTFESEEQARNVARAFDWIAVGGKDYCPCRHPFGLGAAALKETDHE